MLENDGSAENLPMWYLEVPENERTGEFRQSVGDCHLFLCERGQGQLVISFGHTSDTDHRELDWPAWTDRFARQKDWSHLAITSEKGTWFRDPQLIEFLENLRDVGFFARFDAVTLFGAAPYGGGFAALAFAPLCPGATVIAFDAQSTLSGDLVPWESRFDAGAARDWSLPFSDAATSLARASRAYVFFDPFRIEDKRHVERLAPGKVTALQGFGLYADIGVALRRMGCLDEVFERAVAGILQPHDFYRMVRARRDLYLYRRIMEDHLVARDRPGLRTVFSGAYKRRARLRRGGQEPQKTKVAQMPQQPTDTLPATPSRPKLPGRRYPRTLGNVWGLREEGSNFLYMSDQYQGAVMGFEERDGRTLAQTPPLAIGMAAFGHGVGLERPLPESFEFHVVDAALEGRQASFQARSHGVIAQRMSAARRHAYRTVIALSAPQAGITATEALPDSPRYDAFMRQIAAARHALHRWDKDFHLDRICLSLLAGAPDTPLVAAVRHYGAVAKAMRHDAAVAAGQASFPHIVISQGAGTATDGRSDVILAEGQLDLAHPALGLIVATPKYPYPLMPDMPATHDPKAQMMVDELEVLAVAAIQEGQRWYCPSLRQAYLRDRTIIVEFSALSDLVMVSGFHGFALEGCSNDPVIADVRVDGTNAYLSFDRAPQGRDLVVTYAWGAVKPDNRGPFAANQGAIRDGWSKASVLHPDETLYRYALSGRVRVMPSDLIANLPGHAP